MASLKEVMEKDKTALLKIGGAVVALLVATFLLLRAFDVIGGGAPASSAMTAVQKEESKQKKNEAEAEFQEAKRKGVARQAGAQ